MSSTSPPQRATADDPWTVSEHDFPRHGAPEEQWAFLLNYAVLAPSGHNTQPWLFRIAGDGLEIYADRRRALPVVDPGDRELVMSCGTTLFHLRVAMRHFGIASVVRLLPGGTDSDLMARVRMGEASEPTLNDHRLFTAIKRRHTNRQPFDDRPVPQPELDRLVDAARAEGATLHVLRDARDKQALAALIAEGDRIQGSDARFRRELAAWVHSNRAQSRDGLPGYALGLGDWASYAGPFVVRTFDWGRGQAARDRQLAEGSPVLLVLTTEEDTEAAWLQAGQALDAVLLQGCAYDLQASFLNQPVEVPALRPRVADLLGTDEHPQLILRMGYAPPADPTPRRPVREVLLDAPP